MTQYIELTIKRFGFSFTLETTNIMVQAMTSDRNGPAIVNGIEVEENYAQIIYRLKHY